MGRWVGGWMDDHKNGSWSWLTALSRQGCGIFFFLASIMIFGISSRSGSCSVMILEGCDSVVFDDMIWICVSGGILGHMLDGFW